MREPRAGIPWSRRRVDRRCLYAGWMASPAWRARRHQWRRSYLAAHGGAEPVCAVCGRPWTLADGHLHHRSYAHLGIEEDRDLIPLCPDPCHHLVHHIIESHPGWLRHGRGHATDMVIARLQARHEGGGHG